MSRYDLILMQAIFRSHTARLASQQPPAPSVRIRRAVINNHDALLVVLFIFFEMMRAHYLVPPGCLASLVF